MSLPRPEYPRPQFARPTLENPTWLCLNGAWQFEIDAGNSGRARGLVERNLAQTITVPFCPESPLSGIEHLDFMPAVWYRRTVELPATWAGQQILLHFQAVDYDATVWVNGVEVGRHRGGFTPFTCNISAAAKPGETATIVVRAQDDPQGPQPRGKQTVRQYAPHGALYWRTTGIWQSVWLEPVPATSLARPRITPDVANSRFLLEQPLVGPTRGLRVRAILRDDQGEVSRAEVAADSGFTPLLDLPIPAERRRLWSPGDGQLYDIDLALLDGDGNVIDQAQSYAGLRSITLDGYAIRINDKPVFQRLVLDQGFYREGIMTAPSDAALRQDIELSLAAGFNGARLHQKVFEERFLYHADKLGYLVWGEFGDWGCRGFGPEEDHQKPPASYITEWLEALNRDYSHPSIVGWCPLNETWQVLTDRTTTLDEVTRGLFLATKAMDTTRPVLDASGYSHRVPETDVYDAHDYTQDPETFRQHHAHVAEGKPYMNSRDGKTWSLPYAGQPFFVSEFGGIWWNPNAKPGEDSWGYGERPRSIEEFYARFEALCAILLDDPAMFGYCYTQLTDVYQEQNGIYTFDRAVKFDMARIAAAQQRPAAIEQGIEQAPDSQTETR